MDNSLIFQHILTQFFWKKHFKIAILKMSWAIYVKCKMRGIDGSSPIQNRSVAPCMSVKRTYFWQSSALVFPPYFFLNIKLPFWEIDGATPTHSPKSGWECPHRWRKSGTCAIYGPKSQLDVEKKMGRNQRRRWQKIFHFLRHRWLNWPVLKGVQPSIPHFFLGHRWLNSRFRAIYFDIRVNR